MVKEMSRKTVMCFKPMSQHQWANEVTYHIAEQSKFTSIHMYGLKLNESAN